MDFLRNTGPFYEEGNYYVYGTLHLMLFPFFRFFHVAIFCPLHVYYLLALPSDLVRFVRSLYPLQYRDFTSPDFLRPCVLYCLSSAM